MDKIKEWATHHKALAIGVGIGVVVLLYLWFRSAPASSAAASGSSDTSGLQAYYAAQSGAAGDAASTSESTDALDASTAQTNAEEAVGLAQTNAQVAPYQAQLDALTLQSNLTAYQDYLSEANGAQTPTGAVFVDPLTGDQDYQSAAEVAAGNNYSFYDITSGQTVLSSDTGITTGTPFTHVVWAGPGSGSSPTPVSTQTTAPLQFGQFVGATSPQLSTPATTAAA